MNNVLITGATGFVGSHMVDYILKHTEDKIYATKRWMEDMYSEGTLKLDYKSCEMMSDDLYVQITKKVLKLTLICKNSDLSQGVWELFGRMLGQPKRASC